MYCSKCKNSFIRPRVIDDDKNDESYECCPHCGSDQHMQDETPIEDLTTAEIKENKKQFDLQEWKDRKDSERKSQEDAIGYYQHMHELHGQAVAERAYKFYQQVNSEKVKYLFFDTETTGLPLDWKQPMTNIANWPRVIQLAWTLIDGRHQLELNRGKHLIYPDGWSVPDTKFHADNGFTTMKCLASGIPIAEALDQFILDLQEADFLVSHNMSFDHNVLGAEMIRAGKKGKKVIKICTKELATPVCRLPPGYRGGDFKWPKLTELYHFLFKETFEDAHDAMGDVTALQRCFFELNKRGEVLKYLSTRVNSFI